ncbi:MAG: hypothetical protein HFG40_05210, partial [Bacilli bacterium]|nr:hypothetical protein [Bacilli bacterium]
MDIRTLNELMNRSKGVVSSLIEKYQYPSNISHLLYLIVPAFVVKYGLENERYIFRCFEKIPIFVRDQKDMVFQAYYSSIPYVDGDKVITRKGIVLNNYENIELMQLLDNLVHEFNHAVNSINNEILWDLHQVKVRTGLSYIIYDRNTLKPLEKEKSAIIEEIINTKQ